MIHLERMSLNAWPALKTTEYKGCVLRYSNGYTKRANCANPLLMKIEDMHLVKMYCEDFYSSYNLPTIFKMISKDIYNEFDSILDSSGYDRIDMTHVMEAELNKVESQVENSMNIKCMFTSEWFDAFIRCNNLDMISRETAWNMLKRIKLPVITASIIHGNNLIACGFGVIENDYIGFYDIVVDRLSRGKGYGKKLMTGLIHEAKLRSVNKGYLQVMASNSTAINLYQQLGFHSLYDYWYRKKE